MNMRQIGWQDVTGRDTTRQALEQTPTGNNLLQGYDVRTVVDWDPNLAAANLTQRFPDGSEVIYIRAGVQERWSYTRATGWQQV